MGAHVLVIEDDEVIRAGLVRALTAAGTTVTEAATGGDALQQTAPAAPDLILLDLGLPDIDGVDLCRQLRAAAPGTTIVALTARTEEIDVVVALDAGADDYITKPFRLAELLARLRAHLRRADVATGRGAQAPISVGDVTVDLRARQCWVHDQELALRPKEFDLLAYLVAEAGSALTREQIMSQVWDEHWWGSTKTLDIHISALRRKLGEEQGAVSRITTLRGVGYRFEAR